MRWKTFRDVAGTRRNNFDFLRFLLASLVILSHSYSLLPGQEPWEPAVRLTHGTATLGGLAVAGFFLLSGFLITKSWQASRTAGDYFKKRVLRIYPGWIAALLVCFLIVGPLGGGHPASYVRQPGTYQFFMPLILHSGSDRLPGVFAHGGATSSVDGSLWTIRYEFLCYLFVALFGLCGLLGARARLCLVGLLIALVTAASWPGAPEWHVRYWGPITDLRVLGCYFLAGMVFYLCRDVIPRSRLLLTASAVAGLLLLPAHPVIALSVFGAYVLFYLAFSPSLRLHGFARHGDFSYGLYIYAFPIQQLLIQHVPAMHHPWALFLLAWPLTGLAAALSWRYVESPFLRLKPRPPVALAAPETAETSPPDMAVSH